MTLLENITVLGLGPASTVIGLVGLLALIATYLMQRYPKLEISAKSTKRALAKTTPADTKSPYPYLLQFPPSRRHTLAQLPGFEKSDIRDVSPETLKSQALPTTGTPDLNKDNLYTTMGFSTQDVRKLGRFPDYAILSGVRNPLPVGPDWDINKATFRPFRPFRWGYHQHMALMKFDPDYWVELERNYLPTMAARKALLAEHPTRIFFHQPASDLATRELMELVLTFLVNRYPQHFRLSDNSTIFHNNLLKTTTNLLTTHSLTVLFENVPEDYCLMLRNPADGFYYLRAAMTCSSVGWNIGQHRDKPLKDIHTHVPDYSKMAMSMDRWFSKVASDTPVMRCSWSLEDWEVMFTTPEIQPNWTRSAFAACPEKLTYKDIRLRCDAQTLRRLPISGAVVFNFKVVITPLDELREEPYIPRLLYTILEGGKENLIEYKCHPNVRRVAMETLKIWAEEQEERGIVERDWEVGTLEESPFFKGWREKWATQQGFAS
ncbi:Protein of unknown function (DUF3445) domain containing protein [Rhypophila decipiens]